MTKDSRESIISFSHVKKSFSTKNRLVQAVDDVSLDIAPGEIFGVIGYSGAGKSTLVRLINALELADEGDIVVNGVTLAGLKEPALRTLRAGIGMVFQQFNLFSAKTVGENVGYPLKLAKVPKDQRQARVRELLDFVGIADKENNYPSQLSGGQKQRVGIARALAHRPSILLADEATSALDPETTADVLSLFKRANSELGITIVIITHEMGVVQNICNRVAVMERGRIVEIGQTYELFAHPQQPVTKHFIQTALKSHPSRETVDRLHQVHAGRLILMSVPATSLDSEAFNLALIAEKMGVKTSIIYGTITEVSDRPLGNVVVEMTPLPPIGEPADNEPSTAAPPGEASEAAMASLLAQLTDQGIGTVDLGTAADPKDDPVWEELVSLGDSGTDTEEAAK